MGLGLCDIGTLVRHGDCPGGWSLRFHSRFNMSLGLTHSLVSKSLQCFCNSWNLEASRLGSTAEGPGRAGRPSWPSNSAGSSSPGASAALESSMVVSGHGCARCALTWY